MAIGPHGLNSISVPAARRVWGASTHTAAHAPTPSASGHARRAGSSQRSPGLRSAISAISGVSSTTSLDSAANAMVMAPSQVRPPRCSHTVASAPITDSSSWLPHAQRIGTSAV